MSTPPRSRRAPAPGSLRAKVLVTGVGSALAIVAGAAILLLFSLSAGRELASATDDFRQEQEIADRITQAVMRQLATSWVAGPAEIERLRAESDAAGREIAEQIRRYLFRPLSSEDRLQLELMREGHQRIEVASARATDLFARGMTSEALASREAMVTHTFEFLEATDEFLRLRADGLATLQARQESSFRLLLWGVAGLGLLLTGAMLIGSIVLQRRVTRPLEELAQATKRLGDGELGVRVPPGQDLEFQVLSSGFNRMAESLQRAAEDLEGRNRELTEALDHLKAAQQELIQSEKLGAIGRMTAGLAHELNNPLASVLGYGELLLERLEEVGGVDAAEAREELVQPILVEAERARHLVRSFLDFSRKADHELGPVNLGEAVDIVLALRKESYREAGLTVSVEGLQDVWVLAERQMLQGVVLNLVNNALDAMRPNGEGALRIRSLRPEHPDGHVAVVFEDDGPGMTHPDRVFEPFFTTKPVGAGTGLGLSLVEGYVGRFGGGVRAENREEGGARFVLRFLCAERPDQAAIEPAGMPTDSTRPAGPTAAPDAIPEPEPELDPCSRLDASPAHSASSTNGRATPRGLRVLVVEDEEPLRRLQSKLLCKLGVEVLLAESAARGREILGSEDVDLVVCDVKMPGESGLEFYRWLRDAHGELAESRFLFVTGDVSGAELQRLAEERPELFVHKPFNVREYLGRVSELIA